MRKKTIHLTLYLFYIIMEKKGMDKILCTCTYTFIINIATNIHVLYQNIQINNVHVHRRRKLKMTNFKHTVKHQINTHYYD